mmetsp:Transcript_5274/g.15495  ORF Transcript_5274/g.15495 Transcript_5274/m.15495 type:complete len:286 (-) Transcript_5274:22-879(-)
MYGCLSEMANPITCSMWPVKVNFKPPVAKSQIFIHRSPEPVANHSFDLSTATERTHPWCPEMTLYNFHGFFHSGLGHLDAKFAVTSALDFIFAFTPNTEDFEVAFVSALYCTNAPLFSPISWLFSLAKIPPDAFASMRSRTGSSIESIKDAKSVFSLPSSSVSFLLFFAAKFAASAKPGMVFSKRLLLLLLLLFVSFVVAASRALLLLLLLASLGLISGGAMCRTASYSSRIFTLIFRSIEGRCIGEGRETRSSSSTENNALVLFAESSASATGSGLFTFVISVL